MFTIILAVVVLTFYFAAVLFSLGSLVAAVKGAPFLPTPYHKVHEMLEMAKINRHDILFDLGCGDGRILIAAAKQGVHSQGWELNPFLLVLAFVKIHLCKVAKYIRIHPTSFRGAPISDATVITIYGLPHIVQELGVNAAKHCKKGTRILSYRFPIYALAPVKISTSGIYLYTV